MIVEQLVLHHGRIKHGGHPQVLSVVDQRERGHGPGLDTQDVHQQVGIAERNPPLCTDDLMKFFQIDIGIMQGDDQEKAAFLCP